MDIRQLNTFLTLAKELNFTKTAELLGYAQSSITAQIKQLEAEMGVPLFERLGKSVALTPAGKALIPYATRIISLSTDLKEVLSSDDVIRGRLNIGVAESLCIYRLPKIIKAYRQQYPEVEISLKLLNCDQFIPMLSDNTLDLAFTIGEQMENPSIVSHLELPEPIVILSQPSNPLASEKLLTPLRLSEEVFILTETGCHYRGAFLKDMQNSGLKIKTVLETGSIQAIKEVTMSGLGLCVLPRVAVTKEIEEGLLVPLDYPNEYRICSQLITHKDKWISPLLLSFINLAKSLWS